MEIEYQILGKLVCAIAQKKELNVFVLSAVFHLLHGLCRIRRQAL